MKQNENILVKNIYYMLSYAFTTLNQANYEDLSTEEFEGIHNLFAAILSKGIGRQIKQGLYREYVNIKEDLFTLRGKLDVYGTIQNQISRKQSLSCEYDVLSENNLLNQILKSTTVLLIRHGDVDEKYKFKLKKEMLFFSEVEEIDLKNVPWSNIHFQKNNQSYQILIGLCQLIVNGMLLTEQSGKYKLAKFIDDQYMCRLYEKFILEYYRKHYPQLHANSSQIQWALENQKGTSLPIMQSDIMLTYANKVLIIDAKYYAHALQTNYEKQTARSAHIYQIFAYVKNKKLESGFENFSVSGMLLYAKTKDSLQPDGEYSMSGNQIMVKNLDLNCDFSEIQKQLNKIATEMMEK